MITAVFTDNDDYSHAYGLWQWDYGQQLRIEGLHLPTAVEIHFALQETGGEAIPRVGTTKDGVTTVTIPDSMLEGNSTAWTAEKAYSIYAWVYLSDRTSGETIKRITMQVKARPKPKAFEAPGDGEIFREAIEAVNDAAKRAEEAGDKAVSAADDAREAAAQTAEHLEAVQGLAEQVETNADTVAQDKQTVAGMLSQTQQAASDTVLSAQAAKLSETAAAQAQTGAEAAEDTARQYAEETEADRQAVANDKQTATQMRESVAADRQAVEQTVTEFDGAAERAMQSIETAQNTAVRAVAAEGDKQVQRIQDSVIDLAPAIHNTASGFVISADDATEGRPFRGLRVFGKSTQVQTTGAQLLRDDLYKTVTTKGITIELKNCVVSFKGTFTDDGTGERPVLDVWINKDEFIGKTLKLVSDHPESYMVFRVTNINGESKYDVVEATIDETVKEVVARFFYRKTKPSSGTVINETQKVMLCESKNKEKPWEPYTGGKPSPSPEYPQEIVNVGESGNITVEVTGRNLLTGRLYYTDYSMGIGFIKNENEVSLPYAPKSETAGIGYVIPCAPEKHYAFSVTNPNENAVVAISEYKTLEDAKNKENAIGFVAPRSASPYKSVYTSKGNGVLVCWIAGKWTDGKTSIHEHTESELLQLEYGDAATIYEPPRIPQSLTLQTPNGLPGVPVSKDGNYTDSNGQQWVCDEVDLERGKYVQRVAKTVINTFTDGADYGTEIRLVKNVDNMKNMNDCIMSTVARSVNSGNAKNTCRIYRGMQIFFFVSKDKFADLNAANEFFADNPVEFRVGLATPIERDLTPEEIAAYKALRTYGPTTVITNDAGVHMEVTYVADTGKYIQNLEERLNAKMVNIQSALISQKTSGGGAFNNSR